MSNPSEQKPAATGEGQLQGLPGLHGEDILDCVHCGICLSVCPTYDLLGTEGDSPRGRIYLMRSLAEGRTQINPSLVKHIDSCLGCRACETACPSAVHYGEFLAFTRDLIEKQYPRPGKERFARRTLVDLLSQPARLAPLMAGARLMQGVFGAGAGPVGAVNRYLFGQDAPSVPIPDQASLVVQKLPAFTPAVGERRARVAILAGCVMQVLFQRINRATIKLLAANGCDVLVPEALGCCGAFHLHNGYLDGARERARALLGVMQGLDVDAFVINSAGCGSSLKEYPEIFQESGDEAWREQATALKAKTRDVCEFLAELGLRDPDQEVPLKVAYHDACHLAHGQQVRQQPRDLLRKVPGLTLVEFKDPDWCCGSAGIYNFLEPEMARQLQARKVDNLLAAAPDAVLMGNPGCHSWIEAGLRARGSSIPVRHTVELLADSYRA